ncbi:MAG: 30S ribosomal protein S6, partial [Chlamydiae bacterium]|nr:30S ribosomal protein S6 [Chlamydiota bacterium]
KEGHYYLLYFSAPSDALDELWSDYHLNEDLIRFMTLRADEVKEEIKFQELPQ